MTDQSNAELAVSTDKLIRELLGVEPTIFSARFGGGSDAPQKARAGLNYFLREALTLYEVMKAESISKVRLRTQQDAEDGRWPDKRSANIAVLVAWALLHEDQRELTILPALESEEHEAMLLAAARDIRLNHWTTSEEADDAYYGLVDLCGTEHVHVGRLSGSRKADRLLEQVTAEIEKAND